jgi:molybdopterin-guanine dinucleotide biosynthesis protein A
MADFDVVILAGGSGRRLGGVDKGALDVGGTALLDRVLAAAAGAVRTVVVGAERPTVRPVIWTRERPAGGGPVAGLAAGLAVLAPAAGETDPAVDPHPAGIRPVVLLATDLPAFAASDLARLLARAGDLARPVAGETSGPAHPVDAVLFEDAEGHRQPLAGVYRADRLRAALAGLGEVQGASMRRLLAGLSVVTVPDEGATADCDTPEQLRAARAAVPVARMPRPPASGGSRRRT